MRSTAELRCNLARAIVLVRGGQATSRRTLADVMAITPTTAGFYVDQLIESGQLCEKGLEQGRMGRPKRALCTTAGAGWFAGIEFNAERVQAASVDFSGQQVAVVARPLAADAKAVEVMALIQELVADLRHTATGPLLGIGLGAPGVVDPQRGLGVAYAFMPDWLNVPVVAQLHQRFKVPVTLENNLRVIALAERWFGDAKTLAHFVILGPRSGFGIAVVHDGRLMGGVHHAAGEIGHWPWPDRHSGTRLHDHLSAPVVWRRLAGVGPRARLPADLRTALAAYVESYSAAWQELVQDCAQVLVTLQLLLDTQGYFLHGPLTGLGPRFCAAVSAATMQLADSLQERPLLLQSSRLGDAAGALGAASLAMTAWTPTGPVR